MRKKHHFFCILLSFLPLFFSSCEWDGSDDENFTNVDKPTGSVQWSVDLAGVNPEEVIQLANGSYVRYTISSDKHDVLEYKYFLDGVEIEIPYPAYTNEIYIKMLDYKDYGKIHNLKLIVKLKSNTGSLADMAGAEYYTGEYDFKIKFFDIYESYDLKLTQSLSENKYLKLEWVKPKNVDIVKYEVYSGDYWNLVLVATINNPNETYFVDKSYYYGNKSYMVRAIPKNIVGNVVLWQGCNSTYKIFNEDNITTSLSGDKLKITLTNLNPYPIKYVVKTLDKIYQFEMGKTTIEIPRPAFPASRYTSDSYIYLLPIDAKVEEYQNYPYASYKITDKQIYTDQYLTYFFDSKSNTMIGMSNRFYYRFDVKEGLSEIVNGTFPNNISYNSSYSDNRNCSYTKSGAIAIDGYRYSDHAIYVFKDCSFKEIQDKFAVSQDQFCISDTHLFYTKNRTLYVLDMNTKQVVDEKKFESLYTFDTQLHVSSNGKYLIHYSTTTNYSWYTIYELKNNKLQELKHEDASVSLICFNPNNESQLFFHDSDDRFKIMDVVSQQISKTVNNRYLFTDPYTGNVLCYEVKAGILNVYDKTFSNKLFTVKGITQKPKTNDMMLVNGVLCHFHSGSVAYYANISESLKKQ